MPAQKVAMRPYQFGQALFGHFSDFKFYLKIALIFLVLCALPVVIFSTVIEGAVSGAPSNVLAFFLGLIIWAIYASYITAFHRRAVRGEVNGRFPLRFGKTELLVMGVQLAYGVVFFLGALVMSFILGAVTMMLAGVASAGSVASTLSIVFAFIAQILFIVALLAFSARLCCVTPLTVAKNEFTFSESFQATEGRIWWLILSFFVALLITFAPSLIFDLFTSFGSRFSNVPGLSLVLGIVTFVIVILTMQIFAHIGAYTSRLYLNDNEEDKVADIFS